MAGNICDAIFPERPIRNIIAHIDDKWSMLILNVLTGQSPSRFTELRQAIPDATPKMLTSSLKALEEDGIIYLKAYPVVPPKVENGLTDRGIKMLAAMQPLIDWTADNMEKILRDRNEHAAKTKRTNLLI